MPKIKTHQVIAKRIKRTKSGKILIRRGGQDHFNARESGKKMRNKRKNKKISSSLINNINRVT